MDFKIKSACTGRKQNVFTASRLVLNKILFKTINNNKLINWNARVVVIKYEATAQISFKKKIRRKCHKSMNKLFI